MRPFPLALCLSIAALFSPAAAVADTADTILITGPGLTLSYLSPSTFEAAHQPVMAIAAGPLANATLNGDSSYLLRPLYGLQGDLSLDIVATSADSPKGYTNSFYGEHVIQVLSSGPVNDTFELIPGTFTVTGENNSSDAYTLSITPEEAAAAPEPASFLLFASGAIGFGSAWRQRRRTSTS